MKSVCSTDPGNPAQSLIRQICYPHLHKFSTRATTWGCDHEAGAITAYIKSMNDHQNFTCKQSATHPYIGASPDGIIECDCCGFGILEVKCPYCIQMEDPSTAYLAYGMTLWLAVMNTTIKYILNFLPVVPLMLILLLRHLANHKSSLSQKESYEMRNLFLNSYKRQTFF